MTAFHLVALSAGLASALASDSLSLVVVPQPFADAYGAKCLDGTPPFYYSRVTASSSSWVIFLEGGGWCAGTDYASSLASCVSRAGGGGGSSNGAGPTFDVGGLLSTNSTVNPGFFDANLVFAKYCDGASFTSFQASSTPVPPELRGNTSLAEIWFRGRNNLEAVLAHLQSSAGLAAATEVVLSGGSAGAVAAFAAADWVTAFLSVGSPAAKVVTAPDAGLFLDEVRYNGGSRWFASTFAAADVLWGSSAAGNLPAGCASFYGPSNASLCFMPQYSVPFIRTPLYLSGSTVDMWAMENILALGCVPTPQNTSYAGLPACLAPQWTALQAWWDACLSIATPLLARNPALGAFLVTCFVHEINVDYCSSQSLPNCRGWMKYVIEGVTLQQAFTAWYEAAMRSPDTWGNLTADFEAAAARAPADILAGLSPAVGSSLRLGPSQLLDAARWPTNPSCGFPPG